MPYGGTTPEQDKKIERCVARVMATGKEKSNAIAICKASITKKENIDDLIKRIEGGETMAKKNTTTTTEQFTEDLTFSFSETQIDEGKRTVRVCALAPCLSRNNRFYPAAIVEAASGTLMGKKSFADHDTRDTKNLIGRIVSEELVDGKLYADIKISRAKGISRETFEKILDGTITDVSIAADGETRRAKMGETYVNEVIKLDIKSVDFVTEGGVSDAKVMKVWETVKDIPTTEGVTEPMIETVEQLKEQYADMVAEIEKSHLDKIAELEASLKEANQAKAEAEFKLIEKELDEFKKASIEALEINEKVKSLLMSKINGKSKEEITLNIENEMKLVKAYEEAFKPEEKEAKVEGVPEAKTLKKEETKVILSSAVIRELDTTDTIKKEAIEKLWNQGEVAAREYLTSCNIKI